MPNPPKMRGDGELDGRGHAEGSVPTRFAQGDGRKRPGKPKGAKSLATIYRSVGKMPIKVDQGGQTRKLSTAEAIVLKQREKALKGDQRAAELLLEKIEAHDPIEVRPDLTAALLAEDAELLASARARGLLDANEPSRDPESGQ